MEISQVQNEDVAAPGGIGSGAAGTGQGITAVPQAGTGSTGNGRRDRVVIGLGVLAPACRKETVGEKIYSAPEDPGAEDEEEDECGAFPEYGDRIAGRLGQKIACFERIQARTGQRRRVP